jgi:thioredoxin 1
LDSLLYIILAIVGFILFMQIFVRVSTLLKKGKEINGISGELGNRINTGEKLLVYFFSPTCAACKAITPIIDQMKKEKSNIYKIDISQKPKISRGFGVMGTPATILVENKKISQYILGAKSETYLRKLVD